MEIVTFTIDEEMDAPTIDQIIKQGLIDRIFFYGGSLHAAAAGMKTSWPRLQRLVAKYKLEDALIEARKTYKEQEKHENVIKQFGTLPDGYYLFSPRLTTSNRAGHRLASRSS